MKGKLLIFSAPSGSGKTTIVNHLLKKYPNFGFSISATTRAPRAGEEDGKHYYFLTEEEFADKLDKGQFAEHEEVYAGTSYGTLKTEVERLWELGKQAVFDVDVVGGLNLKKYYGDNALAIFVRVPSLDVLEKRLRDRGTETEENIQKRLGKVEKEMAFEKDFDVTLVNDNLEDALARAEVIIDKFLAE